MRPRPVLELCARITGHDEQHRLLRQAVPAVGNWDELLQRAEQQGMAPLLHHHLQAAGCPIPEESVWALTALARRHEHLARVRSQVLRELLAVFREAGLSPLVIKGAALSRTIYPHPGLRPMRDIDLLFHPDEAHHGQRLAKSIGFAVYGTPVPDDHYHLPPLIKTAGPLRICLEIHRGLYPDCPPYYPPVDVARMLARARAGELDGEQFLTPGLEDTLIYLYQHGFRTPLSYEPYKLIHAADLIGFVEHHGADLDWQRIRHEQPALVAALAVLHHLTPWHPERTPDFLARKTRNRPLRTEPFRGWPQRKLKQFKQNKVGFAGIFTATFLPPRWWTMVYYGADAWWQWLWCYCWRHPRQVFWWARLYYTLSLPVAGHDGAAVGPFGRRWNGLCAVLQKFSRKR